MPPITIVQGAQFGSEGKGAVAGALALRYYFNCAVRTGAINAGHTVYFEGKPYAMQQLPVAWVRRGTNLVIGPGAYVHYPTLIREIDMIRDATGEDPSSRIYIDRRVGVHLDTYAQESADINRHHLIGATGKGCAEAIIHKIKDRGSSDLLLADRHPVGPWRWADVPEMLTTAYENGEDIMIEGTQGELLDFHLGPWPFVTSRQTTSAAWVAEAGLSPALDYDIVLVARCYPIRVAGNSGPLPYEITWPGLARRINLDLGPGGIDHPMCVDPDAIRAYEEAVRVVGEAVGVSNLTHHNVWDAALRYTYRDLLSEYSNRAFSMISDDHQQQLRKLFEFTTVTKKLRRIAHLDVNGLRRMIGLVKPKYTVLTFLNYKFPHLYGGTELTTDAKKYAEGVHENVLAVTTGPLSSDLVWLP